MFASFYLPYMKGYFDHFILPVHNLFFHIVAVYRRKITILTTKYFVVGVIIACKVWYWAINGCHHYTRRYN